MNQLGVPNREASALANEIPEESEQFRFLRAACFANIKGSVGLIVASAMRISIPIGRDDIKLFFGY